MEFYKKSFVLSGFYILKLHFIKNPLFVLSGFRCKNFIFLRFSHREKGDSSRRQWFIPIRPIDGNYGPIWSRQKHFTEYFSWICVSCNSHHNQFWAHFCASQICFLCIFVTSFPLSLAFLHRIRFFSPFFLLFQWNWCVGQNHDKWQKPIEQFEEFPECVRLYTPGWCTSALSNGARSDDSCCPFEARIQSYQRIQRTIGMFALHSTISINSINFHAVLGKKVGVKHFFKKHSFVSNFRSIVHYNCSAWRNATIQNADHYRADKRSVWALRWNW